MNMLCYIQIFLRLADYEKIKKNRWTLFLLHIEFAGYRFELRVNLFDNFYYTRFSKPRRNPIICFGGKTYGWADGQTRLPCYAFTFTLLLKERITKKPVRMVDWKNRQQSKRKFVGRCRLTDVLSVAVTLFQFHSLVGLASETIFTTTPAAEGTQLIL